MRGVAAISSPSTSSGLPARRAVRLDEAEALRLLASVSMGRIAFTHEALPAIRPVNHLVDDGVVVVRTHDGVPVVPAAMHEVVVAYQADLLDPVERTGWSVIVTGIARLLRNAEQVAYYQERVEPWVDGDMDQVLSIRPSIVTGLRLVDGQPE
jgi:Pyridoxamine 5'-phosphate oxidase